MQQISLLIRKIQARKFPDRYQRICTTFQEIAKDLSKGHGYSTPFRVPRPKVWVNFKVAHKKTRN